MSAIISDIIESLFSPPVITNRIRLNSFRETCSSGGAEFNRGWPSTLRPRLHRLPAEPQPSCPAADGASASNKVRCATHRRDAGTPRFPPVFERREADGAIQRPDYEVRGVISRVLHLFPLHNFHKNCFMKSAVLGLSHSEISSLNI